MRIDPSIDIPIKYMSVKRQKVSDQGSDEILAVQTLTVQRDEVETGPLQLQAPGQEICLDPLPRFYPGTKHCERRREGG